MDINYNYIFNFLEKENIFIDKTEFLFQIKSHPDYPSLLSISDTLSFFDIENGAIRLDFDDLESLPDRFIGLLKKENSSPILYFIEKKGTKYFIVEDTKKLEISLTELEKRWEGILLLVENNNIIVNNKFNKFNSFLPFLCLIIFVMMFCQFEGNYATKLFLLFPIIGILFSIAALKDLFGAKIEFINNFCNISATTSCSSIVGSSKWRIFNYINFSDLSIVFFISQFLFFITMLFSGNINNFFSTQLFLLTSAFPVILLSLYFQKYVEKKWCPICLVIISIVLAEFLYVFFVLQIDFTMPRSTILTFGKFFIFTFTIWRILKETLLNQKELKDLQFEANRFKRNYEIFKNTLVAKSKIELPFSPIVLGNINCETVITVITSPFCGYCKEAHEMIESLLNKHSSNLQIKIIFSSNYEYLDDESKNIYINLVSIYYEKGEKEFSNSLSNWFKFRDVEQLKVLMTKVNRTDEICDTLKQQDEWCINNKFNFTPAIFINDYQYPKRFYERKSLLFFIDELLEDDTL